MVFTCPRCHRSLSSAADAQPQFCMYCGQKLGESGTTPLPTDTHTRTFLPQEAGELSGVSSDEVTRDSGDAPVQPEPAPEEVGGFKIGRRLGAGGMGTVYEAEAPGTGDRVAVKLLSSRLASNPAAVERFRQEGRLASQLAHPRCVFVLSADTEHGRPYIVMELMPGRTLKDLVDENGPLTPHDAVARVLDVIDGLAEAHRVGMIHRDVKPSNCFLTADDRIKVGDFGLSKSLGPAGRNNLTQTGAFLGTVLFASPEQIRGEPLDYSSDVYSVAATLYFLLTGQAPFHHDNPATALAKAISDPLPRVRAVRPDVPAQLERVISKGLERDRGRRWQTLDDLREALADLLPERQRPARPRALVAAYLLDRILLMFLIFPLEVARLWLHDAAGGRIDAFEVRWLAIGLLFAYFALGEGLFGATPGKWLLGLRIAREGRTEPPGIGRALVRTVAFHALLGGMFFVPEELVQWLGPRIGGALGVVAGGFCAAGMFVQLRRVWGFRGLHDFASGCRATQKPLRARKLRLAVRQPTPLETPLPPPGEALPEVVGGFAVRTRLSADPTGEQVWLAEDRALGRSVLLWLRPWGSPDLGTEAARPTRLRRLGHGSLGWSGAAFDWVAYAAPLGGPLVEAIRPDRPLPWADARYLIEQLVEEFRAAEADDSLPTRLALDHVWVEPNGRVQVLDFPLCAARYRTGTPHAVLREAAALILEGRPRSSTGAVAAPLPAHALAVLNRLFAAEQPLAEFQRELTETHAQAPEVTSATRAAHLGIQAVLLAVPVAAMFAVTFALALGLAITANERAEQSKRAAEILTSPEEAVKLPLAGNNPRAEALKNPRAKVRATELAERSHAEAVARRGQLFLPQRVLLEQYDRAVAGIPAPELDEVRATEVQRVLLWAGAPDKSESGRAGAPWKSGLLPVLTSFLLIPLGLVLLAALVRGGVSMMLAGVAIVGADGRPAFRRQCAARAFLVWLPIATLLLLSSALQVYAPSTAYLAALVWLAAAALLPVYAVVALRYPNRPPQDRLAGTYLVPV